MSDEESTARLAELLSRGPAAPPTSRTRRLRQIARSGVLRVLRPYTAYQHELDDAILGGLRQLAKTIEAIREGDKRRNERHDDLWTRTRELEGRSRKLEERSLPTLKDLVVRQRARIDGLGLLATTWWTQYSA